MKTLMTTVLPVTQVVTSPPITTIRERPCTHSTSLSPTSPKRSQSSSSDVVTNLSNTPIKKRIFESVSTSEVSSVDDSTDVTVDVILESENVETVSSEIIDLTPEEVVVSTIVPTPLKRSLSSSLDEDVITPVKKRIRISTISSIDDGSHLEYITPDTNDVGVVSSTPVEITPEKTVADEVTDIPGIEVTTTVDVIHDDQVECVSSTDCITPGLTVHGNGLPWVNPPVAHVNLLPNILPVNPFGIMGSTPITNPVTSLFYPLSLNPLVSPFPPITPVITSPFIPTFESIPFPLIVPTISSTHIPPFGSTMLSSTPVSSPVSARPQVTVNGNDLVVDQVEESMDIDPVPDDGEQWPARYRWDGLTGSVPLEHSIPVHEGRIHRCPHCQALLHK